MATVWLTHPTSVFALVEQQQKGGNCTINIDNETTTTATTTIANKSSSLAAAATTTTRTSAHKKLPSLYVTTHAVKLVHCLLLFSHGLSPHLYNHRRSSETLPILINRLTVDKDH